MALRAISKGTTLSEQAYLSIRNAIVVHELPGKAPLIEEKLSDQLSISRTPIRSALRRLMDEGLAETDGKNIVVSDLTQEDVDNIKVVRLNLELLVIDELEGKVTPELISELAETTRRQRAVLPLKTPDEYVKYIHQDSIFHTTLARGTRNRFLYDLVRRINTHSSRALMLSQTLVTSGLPAIEEHESILNAIRRGDFPGARSAMESHILSVGRRTIGKG